MGLDSVEILMAVEQEFDVSITDAEASGLVTVGDLHAVVLVQRGVPAGSPEAETIWRRIQDIVVEESGVARHLVVPKARIAKDLGID